MESLQHLAPNMLMHIRNQFRISDESMTGEEIMIYRDVSAKFLEVDHGIGPACIN